ncbi:MAG: pinensin family lanthipeptide [Bacteroidota bacterium]
MKKKLQLNDLRVNSFVTSLNEDSSAKLKGGAVTGGGALCDLTVTILDSSPQKCRTNTLCATTP